MASQRTPNTIRRIDAKLSSDVKTIHGEGGDEAHRQVTSDTLIVEENDGYPAFIQSRLDYLHGKIASIEEGRGDGNLFIGVIATMVLMGILCALASAVTLAAGIGLAFLDIATAGTLMGIVHLATSPAMKQAQKEEREMFDALAVFHREKSLAMAAHANQDDQARNKPLPAASLRSDFAARADGALPPQSGTPASAPKPPPLRGFD